jgi:K+-sensing histidine kinase KdpD
LTLTSDPLAQRHPIRKNFGRRKFDKQPTQRAAVLIATNGLPIPPSVIRTARTLSEGEAVAVVTIARIYGSSLGLPNPGLMPTKREMAEQKTIVETAIKALEKSGTEAWGQVAASRKPAKTIAEVAVARRVRHILVVREDQVRWRKFVEGDLAKEVSRKVKEAVHVEGVSP